ncbi:hypothetical protein CAEBREN_22741 [Caenorhabditis brenneri]|uniref:CUB-like domain-containing protein n=1 Tax=Caenorhabditis brenneri TaxID=135651 RepID=G0MRU4_CAEBE|nr:hypothetical protein CAEBREN_22741 [Caenorhabditis brenneri]
MLKLVALLVFLIGYVYGQAFTCPTSSITVATPTGNLPTGVTNVTNVPAGTNCSFVFDVPNNYVILLKFSIDFQSDDDYVYIYDNNDAHKYYMINPGYAYYDSPLFMPATKATVRVVPSTAQTAGSVMDPYLHDIFVYDGDNINTATFLGNLDYVASTLTVSSGQSLSFVNPYGTDSAPFAYFLGNDASAVQGFNKYFAILATSRSIISGSMSDVSEFGAAYTFICVDCSTYYWTQMQFDMSITTPSRGSVSFQGQTPTHKRDKLIRYDPTTYTQNYLPQMMPTDILTINLVMSRIIFNVTTASSVANHLTPFDGRKGYIFSPNSWTPSANSFNYEFRDDSNLFNYTLNFDKMSFQSINDALTLKIGSGDAAPTVDQQYPRDQFGDNVTGSGNYMQVGLTASANSDIRLSYAMTQTTPSVCPSAPINVSSYSGNLPVGATNVTLIPAGTNCSFVFDIPNNYVILLKFSIDFQSDDDFVYIYDNYDNHKYYMLHPGYAYYDDPLFMPARSASVKLFSASGKTKFMLSYAYYSLGSYQQVTKNTGEYFPLTNVTRNVYYTISASSSSEQVLASTAQTMSAVPDAYLHDIFVYDGDNINTANFLGNLDDVAAGSIVSSGRSISIVNLYGSTPSPYFLGNDASTVQGFNKYFAVLTTSQSWISASMSDTTEFGAGFTFICLDCTTYFWTQMLYDSKFTTPSRGYIQFQGQTPTHKREKLITYDPNSFTQDYLPQIIPTDIFTINLFKARVIFNMTTASSLANYDAPFSGRKGYIFAPTLWTSSSANSFNFNFRDDSQQFNYNVTFNKMSFPVNTDVLTLKIGSGSGAPTVDNQYPRDQFGSGFVSANGNYLQVGLTASSSADVRLSFEMAPTGTVASTTAAPVTTPTTPSVVVTTATVTVPTGQTAAPVSSSTVAPPASTVTSNSSPVTATNTGATVTATVQTTTSEGISNFHGFLLAVFVLLALW